MGGNCMRTSAATESAVCQMRLSSPVEMAAASRPVTAMDSRSLARKRQSRYTESATPRASKPGPRLALDAGTRTVDQDIQAYCSGGMGTGSGCWVPLLLLVPVAMRKHPGRFGVALATIIRAARASKLRGGPPGAKARCGERGPPGVLGEELAVALGGGPH